MYATVALLSPPHADLTYTLPPAFPDAFWQPGLRVAVPLGKGERGALRAAVLLRAAAVADTPPGIACRELCWPLEESPCISGDLLALAKDLARRQGVTVGRVLGHVLPAGLRSTRVRLHCLTGGQAALWTMAGLREAAPDERDRLARALAEGSARLLPSEKSAADLELCVLCVDPPWPVRPSAKRQAEILEYLYQHGPASRRRLQAALPRCATALRSLLQAGHVRLARDNGDDGEDDLERAQGQMLPPAPAPFSLNDDQAAALGGLLSALESKQASARLLFGVTGSGKTAVYLELAKACLASGRSALLLAPEVALAHKLRRDAACALPHAPLVFYHGYQTPARREAAFRRMAARRAPCLVVGTRSALFLPVPRLSCIVLDEEHDSSFKQDESLAYHAKEVAWFRMLQAKGLLVLGSATPDIKTMYAAEQGRLPVLRLPCRVGGRPLPPVELVDISGRGPGATSPESLLAPPCEDALRETLARGEQAVVLLNRRGYAPVMYCLDCNRPQRCPQCDIGMTYHKGQERLVCHYCGYSRPMPSPCPDCGGVNYLPLGEGTERLAERLCALAGGPVLRLDRDSTRRPGQMEDILAAFARQESPILVGTQMLSKGHHFPQVTLAIVADGDLGLNLPDYRAAERTFQMLLQSAGRAGRGDKPGRVLIQTRDMAHYCWRHVRAADYAGFYHEELAMRRLRQYPPFVRLALLRISYALPETDGPAALGQMADALRRLARELGVRLLGPAPAPIAMLRGRKRFACLLKGQEWGAFRALYAQARAHPAAKILRVFLDLDPVNML